MKSNYFGIWLLLAAGLLIMLIIAFADDVKIGNYTLKKAPFRESLLVDEKAKEREAKRQDSILAQHHEAEKQFEMSKESRTDSTPQSILLIGDSMTFNLAFRLAQYAKANGHTFHSINWDSSGTVRWGKTNYLANYIKEFSATYVFICLGSNELYIRNPESHGEYIKSILNQVGDIPYVWIGPPNWKKDYGINDYLEATCAPGSYFRSEGMKFERKKDGIHPTRNASALWIDSIARWIPKSAHPILMNTPPDTLGNVPTNLIYKSSKDK